MYFLLSKIGGLGTDGETNCTPSGSDEFPTDIFTREQRLHGAIVFHCLVSIYCFTLLTIVCDRYFLPSVELIVKRLKISENVGAATFMSIATSAPELCVNLVGTFLTHSDIGIGTIVGSSGFNTLGVAALGGLAAVKPLLLNSKAVKRDCAIYACAVIALIAVIWDDKIYWYEALFLVVLGVIYFVIMFSLPKIGKHTSRTDSRNVFIIGRETVQVNKTNILPYPDTLMDYGFYKKKSGLFHVRVDSVTFTYNNKQFNKDNNNNLEGSNANNNEKRHWIFTLWYYYSLPIRAVLAATMPNVKKKPHLFPVTFVMCVVWIGIYSYIVSWMITLIGQTFGITDSLMGMTFLAAGGGLPEGISIIIMARRGIGDFGTSNALGANTMDIVLCLAVPWLVKTTMVDNSAPIELQSNGMEYLFMLLILVILSLYLTLSFNKFILYKRAGCVLLGIYLLFITVAILFQSNVFFQLSLPACK